MSADRLRDMKDVQKVAVEFIAAQRAAGWPDIHPEDYCHRCGARNPLWFTDQGTWVTATAAWAAQTGREGICCPWCLAEMHEHATGRAVSWLFTPDQGLSTSQRFEWGYRSGLHGMEVPCRDEAQARAVCSPARGHVLVRRPVGAWEEAQ